MKRVAIPVETDELCHYGCGLIARFRNWSGNLMCCQSTNSCLAMRRKNSERLLNSHASGHRIPQRVVYDSLSQDVKDKMAWNRGNFSADFSYNGKGSHKQILISERGYRCECCSKDKWLDKPIPLELEHVDGDNRNNNKENLKLLCPNCHALTPTYRGRGINTGRKTVDDLVLMQAIIDNEYIILRALQSVGMTPKGSNYNRCYDLIMKNKIAAIC